MKDPILVAKERFAQYQAESLFERFLRVVVLWSPFGVRLLGRSDEPYLLRTYLLPRWKGLPEVFLHCFLTGDQGRVHNHPNALYSFVLLRGYREFRYNKLLGKEGPKDVTAGKVNIIRSDDFHRVELFDSHRHSWTLVVRGPKPAGADWGFLDIKTGEYTSWVNKGETT